MTHAYTETQVQRSLASKDGVEETNGWTDGRTDGQTDELPIALSSRLTRSVKPAFHDADADTDVLARIVTQE